MWKKLLLFCFLFISISSTSWGAYSAVYKLVLNGTGQTNFPVPFSSVNNTQISGILSKFATTGNSGLVTSASGYDIAFYSDASCSTLIPFERVIWNSTATRILFFFKGTTNGIYYLCIGNNGVSSDLSNPTAVWPTSYKRVYHTPDGTSLTSPSPDSTSNADSMTLVATPTASLSTIGGAATFNGSSQYLTTNTGYTMAQPYTFMALVKPTSVITYQSIYGGGASGIGADLEIRIDNTGHLNSGRTFYSYNPASTGTLTANVWQRVAITVDISGNFVYYINGVSAGSGTATNDGLSQSTTIGSGFNHSDFFGGSIAEVYLQNVSQSSNWMDDDNKSIKASSTFITVTQVITGGFPVMY